MISMWTICTGHAARNYQLDFTGKVTSVEGGKTGSLCAAARPHRAPVSVNFLSAAHYHALSLLNNQGIYEN